MIQVVKIGGNVVDNPEVLDAFLSDFAKFEGSKVLVHGGGVMASQMQKSLGMEPVKIEGRRVTDAATLQVVTMVYAGWCNKNIVSILQKYNCNAIGLAGCDGNAVTAAKRPPIKIGEQMVDFGFVGDVTSDSVNASFLNTLLEAGITPVLCAINHDGNGNLLNTNADTIASSVATALKADELIYCFEKDGVLYDKDDDSSVITSINPDYYLQLKAEGRIADGMIPKMDNSFKAIREGVGKVTIKHARNLLNDKGTTLSI